MKEIQNKVNELIREAKAKLATDSVKFLKIITFNVNRTNEGVTFKCDMALLKLVSGDLIGVDCELFISEKEIHGRKRHSFKIKYGLSGYAIGDVTINEEASWYNQTIPFDDCEVMEMTKHIGLKLWNATQSYLFNLPNERVI